MRMRFTVSISMTVLVGSLWLNGQGRDFRPVTEAMLRNPAAGDWLNWRRTDNAWGYSPLDQINRQNVQHLQLAWSWAMDDSGSQQATPLVYDGIMYLPNPRGVIQALDAATGDLIWEYRPAAGQTPAPAPTGGSEQTSIPRLAQRPTAAGAGDGGRGIQRNVAIFGDKIFGTTNDAHIVALDARTGKLVWDKAVADLEARVRVHLRANRRPRQGDRWDDRMHTLQGRCLFHQRARCGHGKGGVAHIDHRSSR